MSKATYKDSGVDLDVYASRCRGCRGCCGGRIRRGCYRPRAGLPGCFSSIFRMGCLLARYKDPVLVSGTDGVGTKLKVAQRVGVHNTVGIDLVGMCVNDVLCCGAEPLFFLDYVAMGRDDPARLEAIVPGISDGCVAERHGADRRRDGDHAGFVSGGRLRPGRVLRRRCRAREGVRWNDDFGRAMW